MFSFKLQVYINFWELLLIDNQKFQNLQIVEEY